jgi:hypothetical protein
MFILPTNASQLFLAARDHQVDCKPPNFLHLEFKPSSCGAFKYLLSDKLFVIVFPETKTGAKDGFMLYAFFKRDFSNFSAVKAKGVVCDDRMRQALLNVRFDCGEQLFKMLCAILHVDADTGNNLNIMQDVFDAKEPKHAKKATGSIKGFDKRKWDEMSLTAMTAVRMYMNRDPVYYNRNVEIARIAKDHGVMPDNVFFMEATEITPATEDKPEYPADNIWGSAVGVKRLSEYIISENGGKTAAFLQYLADPIRVSKTGSITLDGVRLGQNRLGVAMKEAFTALVGKDFEHLDEGMDSFILRCMDDYRFDCIVMEPEPKRARSGSA